MKIAVSFIKSKLNFKDTIKKIDTSIADYIHVDYMDGIFVSEMNFKHSEVIKWISNVKKPLSIHLMCNNPAKLIKDYALLNTDVIYFHKEAVKDVINVVDIIHSYGIKAGLAINPETEIEEITNYLDVIDEVLVMSVNPGLGGQEFISDTLEKIVKLNAMKNDYHFSIAVDGGINEETSLSCFLAGVDTIISGSFICMQDKYDEQIKLLRQ